MFLTSQEKAYTKIREMILTGSLRPGEHIPEQKVAQLIGLRRGPVRESLIKLESEGLLVKEPHFGFMIRQYDVENAVELYDLREVIESAAARMAAEKATPEAILAIRTAHEEMLYWFKLLAKDKDKDQVNVEYAQKGSAADEKFHSSVIDACGNSRFKAIFATLHDEHVFLSENHRSKPDVLLEGQWKTIESHELILDAIERHDADAAEKNTRIHIQWARIGVIEKLTHAEEKS